jgi:hypothetical protein
MGDDSGNGARPWAEQTVGERIVTAAWRAVAAHLAREQQEQQEDPRVAAGGAGDLDPPTLDPAAAHRDRFG